jgi:hypothetical protein
LPNQILQQSAAQSCVCANKGSTNVPSAILQDVMATTVQRWDDFISALATAAAVLTPPTKVPSANKYGLKADLVLNMAHVLIRDAAATSNAVWSGLLLQKVGTSSAGTCASAGRQLPA